MALRCQSSLRSVVVTARTAAAALQTRLDELACPSGQVSELARPSDRCRHTPGLPCSVSQHRSFSSSAAHTVRTASSSSFACATPRLAAPKATRDLAATSNFGVPQQRISHLHTSAAAHAVAQQVDDVRPISQAAANTVRSSEADVRLRDILEVAAVYEQMRCAIDETVSGTSMSQSLDPQYLDTMNGRLAYHSYPAASSSLTSPGVIFCNGLMSNMNGKKATALEVHARQRGHPYVRFDYRGHGASEGDFESTCLGDWYEDTLAIIDHVARPGCQHVLVGSSIGAWIALKAAAARREVIQGLVLMAPAVDITEVWWDAMTPEQRASATASGFVTLPNSTPAGLRVRVGFFEEASNHCILDVAQRDQQVRCPVRIFQGTDDNVVPSFVAKEVASWLESRDVNVTVVQDGNHRLSRPDDICAMMLAVEELLTYNVR